MSSKDERFSVEKILFLYWELTTNTLKFNTNTLNNPYVQYGLDKNSLISFNFYQIIEATLNALSVQKLNCPWVFFYVL